MSMFRTQNYNCMGICLSGDRHQVLKIQSPRRQCSQVSDVLDKDCSSDFDTMGRLDKNYPIRMGKQHRLLEDLFALYHDQELFHPFRGWIDFVHCTSRLCSLLDSASEFHPLHCVKIQSLGTLYNPMKNVGNKVVPTYSDSQNHLCRKLSFHPN